MDLSCLVGKDIAMKRNVPSLWHTGDSRFENGTLIIFKYFLFYFLAHLNSPEL